MSEQDTRLGGTGAAEPQQHRVPDVDDAPSLYTPSQAEGDRECIEQDLAEKLDGAQPGSHYASGGDGQGDLVTTPSQAEGERGEVDEDLREKGGD